MPSWRSAPPDILTLSQKGKTVTGRFGWQLVYDKGYGSSTYCYTGKGGTLQGTVKGRTLMGTMTYPARGGHPRSTATVEATMSQNGRAFDARSHIVTGECAPYGAYPTFEAVRVGA